jgi:metallo-beta-lactamase class B
VVYADSLNAVSSDGFRFTGGNGAPSLIETFRRSIAKVAALPCDVMISVHPSFDSFMNPNACKTYAKGAAARLDVRIAEEAKKKEAAAR